MESEIGMLKRELARTKEALRAAREKCRILATRLEERNLDRESEAILRDQQLSRILRALLVLESRLVWEQKLIGRLLTEKDDLIREQQIEMEEWRRSRAGSGEENQETSETASAPCSLGEQDSTGASLLQTNPNLDDLDKREDFEPIYVNKTGTTVGRVDDKLEETNANWYSDPDEDKNNEEPFGPGIGLFNGNRNSVLECVNQILLRDMEEEREDDSRIPKEFKHRGRVVRFEAARLSDIESVGSEMERKNSQENVLGSNDEQEEKERPVEGTKSPGVLILERVPGWTFESLDRRKSFTIAKNLDYEDIESLSEVTRPPLQTTPNLRPQFKNNTLILKKIPSPSFLIDETRKRQSSRNPCSERVNESCSSSVSSSGSGTSNDESTNIRKFHIEKLLPTLDESRVNVESSFFSSPLEEFRIEGENGAEETRLLDKSQDITANFEEFNLDECDLLQDSNETEILQNLQDNYTTYDNFLEATGLSNKSILTPSRLLSNHKSALKPKDVKYKNKVKATAVAITEKHESSGTTRVKRWTGPFV